MSPRSFLLSRLLVADFGVDLGTSRTRVCTPGMGILLDEPTVVALRHSTRDALGKGAIVGQLAELMHGRTPDSIRTVRPMQRGVVSDVELCQVLLRSFLRKVRPRALGLRPRMLVAGPVNLTPVERHALVSTAARAGTSRVFLIAKSQAAALGAGLPLAQPVASMICDIGAGVTEIAVVCLGEIAASEMIHVAGDDMTRAVADYLRRRLKLHVGEPMAEHVKLEIGTAVPVEKGLSLEVSGRDAASGMPRKMLITSDQVCEALADPVRMIVEAVERTLDRCPPELAADLTRNGMVLVGGGAQLRELDARLKEVTGMPVRIGDEPTTAVARGITLCLENLDVWQGLIRGRAAA